MIYNILIDLPGNNFPALLSIEHFMHYACLRLFPSPPKLLHILAFCLFRLKLFILCSELRQRLTNSRSNF